MKTLNKEKLQPSVLAETYIKLTNLQRLALANMDLAAVDIHATAFEVFKPAFSLKRIYGEMKPVTKDNFRMVLSALDDYGLVSDNDWDMLSRKFMYENDTETYL